MIPVWELEFRLTFATDGIPVHMHILKPNTVTYELPVSIRDCRNPEGVLDLLYQRVLGASERGVAPVGRMVLLDRGDILVPEYIHYSESSSWYTGVGPANALALVDLGQHVALEARTQKFIDHTRTIRPFVY